MTVFDPKYYDPAKAVQVNPKTGNPIPGTGDPYNGIIIPGNGWPDAAKGRVPIADSGAFNSKFVGEPQVLLQHRLRQFPAATRHRLPARAKDRDPRRRGQIHHPPGRQRFDLPGRQPAVAAARLRAHRPGGQSRRRFPGQLPAQRQHPGQGIPHAAGLHVESHRSSTKSCAIRWPASATWDAADCTGSARRTSTSHRSAPCRPTPASTSTPCGRTKAMARSAKPSTTPTPCIADSSSNSTAASANGLSYGFAYTLSSCSDDGSAQRDVIPDAYDAHFLWGPCDYDNTHVAVINFIYQLPFFRNVQQPRPPRGGGRLAGHGRDPVPERRSGQGPDQRRFRGHRPGQRQPDLVLLELRQLRPGRRLPAGSSRREATRPIRPSG